MTQSALLPIFLATASLVACDGRRAAPVPRIQTASPVAGVGISDYKAWCDLLDVALRQGPGDKQFVESLQEKPPSKETGKLAAIVLEEWELPRTDEHFGNPRVVSQPRIDWGRLGHDKVITTQIIVVTFRVNSDGLVSGASVVRSTGNPDADNLCLDQVRATRYRPVVQAGRYSSSDLSLLYHVEVR